MIGCPKIKNPCKTCGHTVTLKNGIQCEGGCGTWAHFVCLNYGFETVQDILDGNLVMCCPCSDCPGNKKNRVNEEEISIADIEPDNYSTDYHHCPDHKSRTFNLKRKLKPKKSDVSYDDDDEDEDEKTKPRNKQTKCCKDDNLKRNVVYKREILTVVSKTELVPSNEEGNTNGAGLTKRCFIECDDDSDFEPVLYKIQDEDESEKIKVYMKPRVKKNTKVHKQGYYIACPEDDDDELELKPRRKSNEHKAKKKCLKIYFPQAIENSCSHSIESIPDRENSRAQPIEKGRAQIIDTGLDKQPMEKCCTQPIGKCCAQPRQKCCAQPIENCCAPPIDNCYAQPIDNCCAQPIENCCAQPIDNCCAQPIENCCTQPIEKPCFPVPSSTCSECEKTGTYFLCAKQVDCPPDDLKCRMPASGPPNCSMMNALENVYQTVGQLTNQLQNLMHKLVARTKNR